MEHPDIFKKISALFNDASTSFHIQWHSCHYMHHTITDQRGKLHSRCFVETKQKYFTSFIWSNLHHPRNNFNFPDVFTVMTHRCHHHSRCCVVSIMSVINDSTAIFTLCEVTQWPRLDTGLTLLLYIDNGFPWYLSYFWMVFWSRSRHDIWTVWYHKRSIFKPHWEIFKMSRKEQF